MEENPAKGSEGEGTLPWDRSSSIRRLVLHAQSGITPSFAAFARSGAGLVRFGQPYRRNHPCDLRMAQWPRRLRHSSPSIGDLRTTMVVRAAHSDVRTIRTALAMMAIKILRTVGATKMADAVDRWMRG